MKSIYDYQLDELKNIFPLPYRSKQIYNWIYKKYITKYKDMTNLPNEFINSLVNNFPINIMTLLKKEKSIDNSIKYLFKLNDSTTVESVLLLMSDKKKDSSGKIIRSKQYTFCISTQVGCKVGCSFCLTAKNGFTRNLTAGEIVAQVMYLKKLNNILEEKSVNIVYMGMGEPLDNYNNMIDAIKIISNEFGLNISTRRQTISTSGISDKIIKLGKENLGIQLAISLHAVDDNLRSELIPMNKAYNIRSIIDAVKNFPIDSRKKIMFEYLVIRNINDDIESANKLADLLSGIKAKINLIYFNPYENTKYERPSRNNMLKFQNQLIKRKFVCTIRESKGLDISAACGQLRENKE